jgi:hypothetical protein
MNIEMNELKLVYAVFLPRGGFIASSKAGVRGFSTPRRVSHEQLVSKRSELGRATARSSGYRSEGTELILRRPVGFGHRCQPMLVRIEKSTEVGRSHNLCPPLACGAQKRKRSFLLLTS